MVSDKQRLGLAIDASMETIGQLRQHLDRIAALSRAVVDTLRDGNKILTAGNGGSAAEAMHMAEELTGRFRTNRRSLPGLSLVADGTALTCIGNDFGFDCLFSRQIEGLGVAGDLLVLFSTSGHAANLRNALDAARRKGMRTVAILGRDGGALAGLADIELCVTGTATERIQEAHQVVMHLILEEVEIAFPAE
jgi:D-sedoheptulose 7-phosphate isomerase